MMVCQSAHPDASTPGPRRRVKRLVLSSLGLRLATCNWELGQGERWSPQYAAACLDLLARGASEADRGGRRQSRAWLPGQRARPLSVYPFRRWPQTNCISFLARGPNITSRVLCRARPQTHRPPGPSDHQFPVPPPFLCPPPATMQRWGALLLLVAALAAAAPLTAAQVRPARSSAAVRPVKDAPGQAAAAGAPACVDNCSGG